MGRKTKLFTIACALVVAWIVAVGPVRAQESASRGPIAANKKPNIVLILVDNVGWGNFGVYGGTIPTPRIDKLANEGIRFNNYNVEVQCTPSRSAIMTGRHPVRSGTYTVPFPGEGKAGSRMLAMRPRCMASGTWATLKADCRTIKVSTSGGAS